MNPGLVLLATSLLTWGFGEGMFLYIQPLYLQELGAGTLTIAGIFSVFGMAMMAAHVPAGYLADRIGRKPLLLLAWGLGLLAAWIMAWARTLTVFVIGWLVYGLTAFVSAPMNSYATAAREKMTPSQAMTLISAAYHGGAALGALTGGWIGDHWQLRSVYIVAAGVFLVSTLMILFIRPQPLDSHDPKTRATPLHSNRRYLTFLGVAFVALFAMYLPQPLTPKFLVNERGLSLSALGLLGSFGSLGNALLSLGLGQMEARRGFLLAQAAVALASVVLWQGNGMLGYAAAYLLLGGFRAARPLVFAQVRAIILPAQMGLAYGIAETAGSLAIILSPLLAGYLYMIQPAMVYYVGSILILVGIGCSLLARP